MPSNPARKAKYPECEGLYLITPDNWESVKLLEVIESIVSQIRCVVQFRHKSPGGMDKYELAGRLGSVCQRYQSKYIINDDVELALATGADGVHLGRDDTLIGTARSTMGDDAIIGISCYNDLGRAEDAMRDGADYVAFGSMYVSSTKPEATACGLDTLAMAAKLPLPVVAIGGITVDNALPLIMAGADMLAVIGGVFATADPLESAKQLHYLIHHNR